MPMTILVSASTGRLGRLVMKALLERVAPDALLAGARNTPKALGFAKYGVSIRELDYARPATAFASLQGVEKLLLISGNDPERALGHSKIIEAAELKGVKHIVYTSVLHADSARSMVARDHAETEAALRASGVPFTLLRNGWYMENYTDNLGITLGNGALFGATGDTKFSPAARADYAEAAAVVLTSEGHEGKIYELGGDAAYSLAEIAGEIQRISGQVVTYNDWPAAEYKSMLQGFGLPAPIAASLADSDAGLARGELLTTTGDLSRLLGRPTTPLSTVIEDALRTAGESLY